MIFKTSNVTYVKNVETLKMSVMLIVNSTARG